MKKPYIKKISKISDFTVWIVDGKYIRDNIDIEFTNYGQHYRFKFIPKNEFWIDKMRTKGEEKFYIIHLLNENKSMSKGMSYPKAIDKADEIEKKERIKWYLKKKKIKITKNIEETNGLIHKKLLKKYSERIKVWIVDGGMVRSIFFIDFTQGGHGEVYPFIPKDEVWIDDDLSKKEIELVLLHELHERKLMIKGVKYNPAHEKANKIEIYHRHHPKQLKKRLLKEIEENNK